MNIHKKSCSSCCRRNDQKPNGITVNTRAAFRQFVFAFFPTLLVVMFLALLPASAETCKIGQPVDAKTFVEQMIVKASEIASEKPTPVAAMMVHIFENFDLKLISRNTFGRHWNSASPQQRADYQTLFTRTTLFSVATQAMKLAGAKLKTSDVLTLGSGRSLVKSKIVNGPGIELDWEIVFRDCRPYVADMVYQGVSLTTTKRLEFNSVVSRIGIAGLLTQLERLATVQSRSVDTTATEQASRNTLDMLILEGASNSETQVR
jgi:phospholipid transport system substrate-binding protein